MLENHVRYYLYLILESFQDEPPQTKDSITPFIPGIVGDLRKLDDMMLCYRVLCRLSSGTDFQISPTNLERLSRSEKYGWLINFILQHFSTPPQYDEDYAAFPNSTEKVDNLGQVYLDEDVRKTDIDIPWIPDSEHYIL